jgi:hypothetical protein
LDKESRLTRRRTTLAALPLAAVVLGGCGGAHYQFHPQPTVPVNVSVYVNSQRVSVSPASVTSGPVTITITNQASTAESLQVVPAGGSASNPLAETGPISPQGTAQLTVKLGTGNYTVTTAPANSTEAAAVTPTGILPAHLHVQGQRPAISQLQTP